MIVIWSVTHEGAECCNVTCFRFDRGLRKPARTQCRYVAPAGFWAHHTVHPRVNGVKDDDPELIAPWEPEEA